MRYFLCLVLVTLSMSGCASFGQKADGSVLQARVEALDADVLQGKKTPEQALGEYSALYKKYPKEPVVVAAYADAQRRAQQPQKAAEILKLYVQNKDVKTLADPLFLSYMRLMLDQGYARDAEKRLRARLALPLNKLKGTASFQQVSNLLGVALAAQGRKAEAEQAFRAALKNWDGRPGVVEKNLARLHL